MSIPQHLAPDVGEPGIPGVFHRPWLLRVQLLYDGSHCLLVLQVLIKGQLEIHRHPWRVHSCVAVLREEPEGHTKWEECGEHADDNSCGTLCVGW